MRKLILPHISVSAATTVYKVFVRPILEFGFRVFDKMTNSNLKKLEDLQKECLSTFTKVSQLKSKSLDILLRLGSVEDRYIENT